jgi:AcrR family transcriptional regulator
MSEADTDGRSARAQVAREVRKKQILDAAQDVFASRGYHGTSVSDLVEAAGVARGTFYLYFPSKAAIFQELVEDLLQQLRASIRGVDTRPGAAPIPEQLRATVQRVLETLAANRALCRILFREALSTDTDVETRLDRFYESLLRYLQEALENGQRLGFVRPIDTRVAALCALGSVKEVVARSLVSGDDEIDLAATTFAVLDYNLTGLVQRSEGRVT